MERRQHKYLINITIIIDFPLLGFFIYSFFFSTVCYLQNVSSRAVCSSGFSVAVRERERECNYTVCWENIHVCLAAESDANTIKSFYISIDKSRVQSIAAHFDYNFMKSMQSGTKCIFAPHVPIEHTHAHNYKRTQCEHIENLFNYIFIQSEIPTHAKHISLGSLSVPSTTIAMQWPKKLNTN